MLYKQKLKLIRKSKKVTQEELGRVLGKTGDIIGYWEQGKRNPGESDIRMMSTYLNIPVQEISDLSEFQKLKKSKSSDFMDMKLKELDSLLEEYGDLPANIAYKISDLKDSIITYKSNNSRLRNRINKYDTMIQNIPFIPYSK